MQLVEVTLGDGKKKVKNLVVKENLIRWWSFQTSRKFPSKGILYYPVVVLLLRCLSLCTYSAITKKRKSASRITLNWEDSHLVRKVQPVQHPCLLHLLRHFLSQFSLVAYCLKFLVYFDVFDASPPFFYEQIFYNKPFLIILFLVWHLG